MSYEGIAAWLNGDVEIAISGTIDQFAAATATSAGKTYVVSAVLRSIKTTNNFQWANMPLTFSVGDTIADAGTVPYLKAKRHVVTMSGVGVNLDTLVVGDWKFEVSTDGVAASGYFCADVSGGATAANTVDALVAAINAANVPGVHAVELTSTTFEILTTEFVKVTETLTNGSVAIAPSMDGGRAAVQVVCPVGTYEEDETVTVTVANLSAPDGRTVTGGTHVLTLV